MLLSLRETYFILSSSSYATEQLPSYNNPGSSSRHVSEGLSPGLFPSVLKHNVKDFTSELKKSLACVLDGKTGSSLNLERCIDIIGEGMIKRLSLTEEYIDTLNKIELLNQQLNYV